MKNIWDWLQQLFFNPNGQTKKIGFLYIAIPAVIGIVGWRVFKANIIWGVGIALQILVIVLIITGAKKYRHSQKNS